MNNRYIQLPQDAPTALYAPKAPTAQQAQRAVDASRAFSYEELKQLRKQNPQVETFLSNYNDPTELNSYIDALTNREAVSKKFGDAWGTMSTASGTVAVLSFIGSIVAGLIPGGQPVAAALATTAAYAALPAVPAAADVMIEKGIKPIAAGKPNEALLNTLMNLGETMDYASNPIKGLILEGPEGFIKGTGLAAGGRVNYDYDTGSFVTDMLLEMVSDPVNMFQMGAKIAIGTGAKAMAKPLSSQIVNLTQDAFSRLDKTIYGEFTQEMGQKLEKNMTKAYANAIKALNDATTQNLSKQAKELVLETTRTNLQQSYTNTLKGLLPDLTNEQLDIAIKQSGRSAITGRFTKSALTQITKDAAFDNLSSSLIQRLSTGLHYSDELEKHMTKHALRSSGYGGAIDLVKKGFKPISEYLHNNLVQKLVDPKFLDRTTGIDISHFEQAKNYWINTNKYMQNITGELSPLDETAFYNYVTNQFNRDKQLIDQLLDKYRLHPEKQAAALDANIKALYSKFGINDFEQYISVLKGANEATDGRFIKFVNHAENVFNATNEKSLVKRMGEKFQKGVQLLSGTDYIEAQTKTIENLAEIVKTNKELDFGKTIYMLKYNDETINAALISDPIVALAFEQISSSDKVGALLDHLLEDIDTLDPEMRAGFRDAVEYLKQSGDAFNAVRNLYGNMGELVLDEVPGINIKQLRRYIIDEIFGLSGANVSDLLANFDNITMNKLMDGLSIMLQDIGFKESNYPGMREQIAQVFKQYLEDLDSAGIEYLKTGIAQDFTSSVNTLKSFFAKNYPEDFALLDIASRNITTTLSQVKSGNLDLSNILGNTILDKLGSGAIRQLSDYGLAVRAINISEVMNYFVMEGLDGIKLRDAERLGKSLKHLKERFEQYAFTFTDVKRGQIAEVYDKFYKTYIQNTDRQLNMEVFRHLKYTNDTVEQFAQLVEFNKTLYGSDLGRREFMQLFGSHDASSLELLQDIRNPSRLLNTDFAWDAMSQTAWLAQREFNETLINGMTAYKNLGLKSGKLANDFKAMRELLSQNKLDRPKALMLERYIKASASTEKYLMSLKDYYNSLFDRDLATRKIEELRSISLQFPEFNEKYSTLITELDEYWKGLKTFTQDAKYMRGKPGYRDTFTPFWNEIKKMNADYAKLQRRVFREEDLAQLLSPEFFEYLNAPEQAAKKESLLRTLTDINYTMTDEDYENYLSFIYDAFIKKVTPEDLINGKFTIPYAYIPASFRHLDFKYYHDILGIEDINMVYNLFDDPHLAGWHTFGKRDINVVANVSKDMHRTFMHESGHNILERVFKTDKRILEYLDVFEKRFIETFGEDYYAYILQKLSENYSKLYTIPIESGNLKYLYEHGLISQRQYRMLREEVFTFSLADELDRFNTNIPSKLIPDTARIGQFSIELTDELERLAAPNRDKFIKETFEEYNLHRLKVHPERAIDSITPWDPFKKQQEFTRIVNKATDAQARGTLYALLKHSPQAFAEELAFRKGFIVFEDSDISGLFNPKQFDYINQQFENNKIHHIYDANTHLHWYVLDNETYRIGAEGSQVYLNDKPLVRDFHNNYSEYSIVDKHTKDFKHSLVKQLQDWDNNMYTLTGSRIGSSQGEIITQDNFNRIFVNNKETASLIPEDVIKYLPKDKYDNVYFDKSLFEKYAFNESFLGTGNTKRKFGIGASNIIVNMDNATASAQYLLKPKVEYVNTVFDSALSISSKNSVWKNFSDQDILDALRETPDYRLIALVEDPKYGSRVQEILPTSIKNIEKARELGAVIVPMQTFKDMYNVVNHRLGASGFSKLWSRIMYIYKFGYLCRPGAWIRNFIDTNLKSKLEMGDMYSTYQAQAHKILNDVDSLKKYIREVTHDAAEVNENIGSIKQLTKRWFDEGNAKYLTFDQYNELQTDFLSQGISGNIMAELYAGEGGDAWQQFTRISGNIIDSVNQTEDYNRLAMYLYELDKGADYTSALSKLAKTHFDYSFKTKAEQLIDLVFPFTTFTLRNYSYWVEALEKQPWLMRNYIHIMKPHWDFKDYTPEELAVQKRVQTQILYGQLKLGEFRNKLLTFKANPSIQDAIQMFSDPINNVYDKLATPISVPITAAKGEHTQPLNVLPLAGPMIQSAKTALTTGTPLPSVIGVSPATKTVSQKTTKWTNSNYSNVNKFSDKQMRVPKFRNNVIYDGYRTKGITKYRNNFYPIVDIAHDVKMRYSVNVYAKIKNKVQTDVYKGIRYRIKLDAHRFR